MINTSRKGKFILQTNTGTSSFDANHFQESFDRLLEQSSRREVRTERLAAEAKDADWTTPTDVKAKYGNASILKGGRVVFNICGNKHRLIVRINYDYRTVYVRFVGTHKEYDQINAETV